MTNDTNRSTVRYDSDDAERDRGKRDDAWSEATKRHDKGNEPSRAIAALFQSRDEARGAIAELHKQHYTHTWLGVTHAARTDTGADVVRVEETGFFSLRSENIVDALVKHGVPIEIARSINESIEPGEAILTVDPKEKNAADAAAIIQSAGGEQAGAGFTGASRRARAEFLIDLADDRLNDIAFEEVFYRSPR